MSTIHSMHRRLKAFDVEKAAKEAIESVADNIADLNAQQMYAGKRADGSDITPEYSDYTIELKKEKGQVADRVTLKDTGAFYAGINVRVEGSNVVIDSFDDKTEDIIDKYASKKSNIFGLNSQFHSDLNSEFLQPAFSKLVENALKLKMQ